jgi:arylsulfatase
LFGFKAYFDGDWKILHMPAPYGKGRWELFNLKQDPAEIDDLSAEFPQRLSKMSAAWERYKRDNGVINIELESDQ